MSAKKRLPLADDDRRRFPRVSVTVPVKLKRSHGPMVTGLMHNLSPGGMQVRLSAEAAAALLPKKGEIDKNAVCSVHARFLLPLRRDHVAITVKTTVVHVSLVDAAPTAAKVAIGFRFKRFKDTKSLRRFVLYIEEQLVPLEDYQLYLNGPASRRKKAGSTLPTPA